MAPKKAPAASSKVGKMPIATKKGVKRATTTKKAAAPNDEDAGQSKPATKKITKATTKSKAEPSTATKATRSKKRKAEDDQEKQEAAASASKRRKGSEEARSLALPPKPAVTAAKQPKVAKAKVIISQPPTKRLDIYVSGEGSQGELGLGAGSGAMNALKPRLNPRLSAADVGVVQLATGAMHCAALTYDNKILTWGVNDEGALGRDTQWDGGLVSVDDNKSDDSSDDAGLNPKEASPAAVEFTDLPEGTRFTQVAAGDSSTFALTDEGQVYGWGTFRVGPRHPFLLSKFVDTDQPFYRATTAFWASRLRSKSNDEPLSYLV
jgi:regulator of chromosome condensation